MNATAKAVTSIGIARTPRGYGKESGESIRFLYNALLSELPGLALGVIALVYIVSAFIGYAYIGHANGLQVALF